MVALGRRPSGRQRDLVLALRLAWEVVPWMRLLCFGVAGRVRSCGGGVRRHARRRSRRPCSGRLSWCSIALVFYSSEAYPSISSALNLMRWRGSASPVVALRGKTDSFQRVEIYWFQSAPCCRWRTPTRGTTARHPVAGIRVYRHEDVVLGGVNTPIC